MLFRSAQTYNNYNENYYSETQDNKLSEIIASDNWDYVSIQQVSGYSGISSSYSNIYNFVNKIKTYLVDEEHTKFAFHMTWAYQSDSNHQDFAKYHNNQDEMYNAILGCVQDLDRDVFDIIIPNGTTVQNARTSYLGDNITRDGFHLNEYYGRYMASDRKSVV